jgi:UPF0755 protein
MIKKTIAAVLVITLAAGAWLAWKILGPGTAFMEEKKYLYIRTGESYEQVAVNMEKEGLIRSPRIFRFLARKLDYPALVKAGKYPLPNGMSLLNMVRMLRNGRQEPVKLSITKLRTKEDFAGLAGRKFECDSAAFIGFLNNTDSLKKYDLDTNTVMITVIPDSYTYFWNTTPSRIFAKLRGRYTAFWTGERLALAKAHNLNPQTAYILASIVEEETNAAEDKGNIASVYLNRMAKGMKLSADPTVKFALRDFGLKRIYYKQLAMESPWNTYKVTGLPPGPICTPSVDTLDAVLNAPQTDYLYFVASCDFSGRSVFAATYAEHLKNAKAYQEALDKQEQLKKNVANDHIAH